MLGIIALLALLLQSGTFAGAQENAASGVVETPVTTSVMLKAEPPESRTPEDIQGAEAGLRMEAAIPSREVIRFRPTMNELDYKAAKAAAARQAPSQAVSPDSVSAGPLAPPVLKTINFDGTNFNETGGFFPPDTHGAVGPGHFVEITNSHLDIYTKAVPNTRVNGGGLGVSLASFFNYTAQTLFDPRCIYDPTWKRWIMTAEAFPESPTVQFHFIAISKTSSPLGAFWLYKINMTRTNGEFWDFPQVGMDQDSIIITGNVFASAGPFTDARMFATAKALLYNGLALPPIRLFTGLNGTLSPPIVLDQNGVAFLLAEGNPGTTIFKYRLQNSSNPDQQTLTLSTITVPAFALPPNIPQPGTNVLLDSGDSRFRNAGTQIGASLFQIHAVSFSGRSALKWYEFNSTTNDVVQSGIISTSGTSYDWNPGIAANKLKDVFVVWSSTNPAGTAANGNAQVRFSGRREADAPGVIGIGSVLFQSTTFYNQSAGVQRWGDYSAVSVDPLLQTRAWIVNQKNNSQTVWGTRIGQIGF